MSIRRLSKPAGALLRTAVCALAMAAAANAQDVTGTISGTVVDDQGAALPGATVTVSDQGTNASRSRVTDSRGDFGFPALPPGTYRVKVEMQSFRTLEHKGVVLNASGRVSLGMLRLAVGQFQDVVTVSEPGTQVNTDDSQHSGLLTSTQIEQIQTKGRDVTSLMRLVPGVRYEDTVESLGESFGTLVPHVSGQRRDWNNITIDGVLGNEIGQANRMAQQINLDAIAEVKVLLNTYRAEYGRTAGANVQIVSKSGDSEYRGNLYYYGRHEKFNANNFFNNRAQPFRPRPRYRFNTFGANIGGPAPWQKGDNKKLFFFYAIEAPLTERPGPLRDWTVPTEAERSGDFSQTVDTAGRPIFIKDPNLGLPCVSPTAANPAGDARGCFPGNRIPASRINPSGQALLNLLPLPTSSASRNFNHQTQETADNPKRNQILRIDWKPTEKDNFYFTAKDWYSDQRGSEVTAGPNKWGWFNTHYLNTDRTLSGSYTRFFSPTVINEASFGVRRQSEQFHPVGDSDFARIRRDDVGFGLGQFHPELNPEGILPKATFNVTNPPNFTYDNRMLFNGGVGWLHSFRDNLTWIRGAHTFKAGLYLEHLYNTEGRGGVGANPPTGQFNFTVDANNPFDTNHSFANALIGSFRDYVEVDAVPEVKANRWLSEAYIQDTWKLGRRWTFDYGLRLLYYKPWNTSLPAAVFVPERYDRARAPRLYEPVRINNTNLAQNPVTGQTLPNIFVGAFVPGTGDPSNGMVLNTDPDYPKGFRNNQGLHPEPRLGVAWDVFGDGRTGLHASVGLFHNAHITARSMDSAANNPPAVNSPTIFYGTMDTLLAQASFTNRPSTVFGLERDAKTPSSYNWSLGVQRDIGWGTVVDLTYIGNTTRHLELATNINVVPDGARFLPENRNPQSTANPPAAKPAEFLRPYAGYQDINIRSHFGTSNYNGLQVQINRRYIKGFQFAVAYTFSKALGVSDEDEGGVSAVRPVKEWHYSPLAQSQAHTFVLNYTWDLPKVSSLVGGAAPVKFLFDNWQLSGENALASGDWNAVILSTTDTFDFTGGDGGTGTNVAPPNGGDVRVVRPRVIGNPIPSKNRNPTPGADGAWLDATAFERQARGDYGNAPRYVFQRPSINNWNLSLFKNFPIGGRRRVQFRAELYNVLNHTQFDAIENNLRYDAAGVQTNREFGEATSARNARIVQGSLRFTF